MRRSPQGGGIPYSLQLQLQVVSYYPHSIYPREMCLKYAELETKLGEIDRARGIFSHGSQMSDPRTSKSYWKAWQEFEVRHGNEDTFREMLRIKRSVQAQYNTQVGGWV